VDLASGAVTSYACSAKPLVVPDLTDAVQIAAGGDTSCARTTSGAVFCWGRNDGGLVGDGTTKSRSTPAVVALPAHAKSLVMSDTHACALLSDASVACWGIGFDGQLGFPVEATGDVRERGELAVVSSRPGRVAGLTGATEVFVGSRLTCARLAQGQVSCFGKVGLGETGEALRAPRTTYPGLSGATSLFLGAGTHCAVLDHGTSCWGASAEGPLAAPNEKFVGWSKLVPATRVASSPRALVLAYGRACAADGDGVVSCFGYDGRGKSAPQIVAGVEDVVALGVGASHVCALDERGAVVCWGGTASGQVGRIEGAHVSPLFGEPHVIALP
jgi:alpha-tubulin suppressor-like RCC1 family protein